MHKNRNVRRPFFAKVKTLDVIRHKEGNQENQGLVLATGDVLCVGKLILNDEGEVWRIGMPGTVSHLAVLAIEPVRLPIQTIYDALARQFDPDRYDHENARQMMLGALAHEAVQVQIF